MAIKGNNVWFHANGDWISGDPNTNASPSYTWATGRDIQVAWNGIGANGTAAGTWSQHASQRCCEAHCRFRHFIDSSFH